MQRTHNIANLAISWDVNIIQIEVVSIVQLFNFLNFLFIL